MTLADIIAKWSTTDQIIYKTPEIKLASFIEAKTKVIAQQ